jgi:hypothetical protein
VNHHQIDLAVFRQISCRTRTGSNMANPDPGIFLKLILEGMDRSRINRADGTGHENEAFSGEAGTAKQENNDQGKDDDAMHFHGSSFAGKLISERWPV